MRATVLVEYFEVLGYWSWTVTVNGSSAYGVESDHDNAFAAAEFALEDMLEQEDA